MTVAVAVVVIAVVLVTNINSYRVEMPNLVKGLRQHWFSFGSVIFTFDCNKDINRYRHKKWFHTKLSTNLDQGQKQHGLNSPAMQTVVKQRAKEG